MDVLSKLKLDQLMRYGYGGVLLISFAYIFRPDIVGTMIESMGVIFTPIIALGLGTMIYVLNRYVIGEFGWYVWIHFFHYIWDKINRRSGKDYTSITAYLGELGVRLRDRREAYTATRRELFDNELREKYDFAHARLHVLWITVDIFLLFYFYMYFTSNKPQIFSSIIQPSYLILISIFIILAATFVKSFSEFNPSIVLMTCS